jgi:hypothetical protein
MRISERQFGTARVLDVHGPLVGREAGAQIERAIEPHLQSRPAVIVVNLAKVADLDCDGVFALGLADRTIRRAGGALRLAMPEDGHGPRMLRRAGPLFDCFESVEDALADVRAAMGRRRYLQPVARAWRVCLAAAVRLMSR